MDDVVSQRKTLLPPKKTQPVETPQAAPRVDVQAIARQQGFDKSGLGSNYRDAGRVIRNRIPRDAQVTVKITAETANWWRTHASETGLSLPDILEAALDMYRSQAEQGRSAA